jgi:hypothetical protein
MLKKSTALMVPGIQNTSLWHPTVMYTADPKMAPRYRLPVAVVLHGTRSHDVSVGF